MIQNNNKHNEFLNSSEPFKDDLLSRKDLAKKWTETFFLNKDAKVISVDASWGMGKTYFAKNWEKQLSNDNFTVCYIDAFEYDFTDDPFMVISNSIITTLQNSNSFTELEDISNYLSILFKAFKNNTIEHIPTIAKGGIIAFSNLLGLGEIAGSVVKILKDSFKEANDGTQNPFDSITKYDITYVHIVKAFKILLEKKVSEIVIDTKKPLIVMIDELDRCKPTFAIEFLEKLKHIFDIDNIIFITFINYNELSNAVKGIYGESFDSRKYLDKFFTIKLNFPKKYNTTHLYANFIYESILNYINGIIINQNKIYNKNVFIYDNNKINQVAIISLISIIEFFFEIYNLSLRDIESLINTLKYINFTNQEHLYHFVILRIIYLHNHDFYNELKKFEKPVSKKLDSKKTYEKVNDIFDKEEKSRIEEYNVGEIFIFFTLYDNISDFKLYIDIKNHNFTSQDEILDYITGLMITVESIS